MFEHVGWKNYRTFFEVVRRCLKENGVFLLHTIGSPASGRGGGMMQHPEAMAEVMLGCRGMMGRHPDMMARMQDMMSRMRGES